MSFMVDEHVRSPGLTVADGLLTGFPGVTREEAREAVWSWLCSDAEGDAGDGPSRLEKERDRLFAGHADADAEPEPDEPPVTFSGPSITGAGP